MRPTFIPSKDDAKKLEEKTEWRTISNWLHWDMDPFNGRATTFGWKVQDYRANVGFDSLRVQGILALTDCGPKDGGFQCVPGFQEHIRGWGNANQKQHFKEGFLPGSFFVPKDDPMHKDVQTCPLRQGSLLIWDSKLPHCTFPNHSTHGRIVQYIKMAPVTDLAVAPLLDKYPDLLPENFELSELGRKIYGFEKWPGDVSNNGWARCTVS